VSARGPRICAAVHDGWAWGSDRCYDGSFGIGFAGCLT
jgi:hypothetical protein